MAYEKEIEAYLAAHQEEMFEDLFSLMRINSERMQAEPGKPYGEGPYQALQQGLKLLKKYGFRETNYDNYVITGDLNDGEHYLDILAHLDVVPVSDDWTVTEPFEPKIVDGRIYGRGSSDDKGPAIAALYAMRAVKDLGLPISKNVRIILGSDEECGSSDIAYYYQKEKAAACSFSPDADFPLINLEKGGVNNTFTKIFPESDLIPRVTAFAGGQKVNVVPGKAYARVKGLDQTIIRDAADELSAKTGVSFVLTEEDDEVRIDAIGVTAHAASPEEGKNAVQALLALLAVLPLAEEAPTNQAVKEISGLFPYGDVHGKTIGVAMEDAVSGKTTLSFDICEITETKASGTFDCRASIAANEENTGSVIRKRVEALGYSMPERAMFAPHYVPADSPFVQTLLASYSKITGVEDPRPIAIGGGTYVHHIENGVAFGCAVSDVDNHMHGADEFMVIDQLMISARIFADVILELCR